MFRRSPGAQYFTAGMGIFLLLWGVLGELFFEGPRIVLYLPHRQRSPVELLQNWEASNRGLDRDTMKKNVQRIYDKYGSGVGLDYIDCHQKVAFYSENWPECDKLQKIVRQFDHPAPKPWWQFW